MTTSKRLAAFRAAKTGDEPAKTDPTRPEGEEDESTANREEGTKPKKEKPMADEPVSAADHASAIADATAKATETANARFSAVLASDEYKGREALATKLLGNASMDANSIIDTLAAAPKAVANSEASIEAIKAAAEEKARTEMLAEMAKQGNSNLEDGEGDSKPDAKAKAASVWDRANAKIEQRRKGN